jgi:Effector-associated domain 9
MMRAMERHEIGEARVVPIILTPVEGWMHSPFAKLQVLPKDGKPVTKWDDRDEAFVNVAQGIRRSIESISKAQPIEQLDSFNKNHPLVSTRAVDGGLSDRKLRRLEQERNSLQQQYDLVSEKLNRLREALAIEVDPLMRLKLEKQQTQSQSELSQIDEQLDQFEQQLG